MTFNRSRFQIDQHTLQRIWDAHALGQITSVDWAGTGMNNPALLINNSHVIRFDGIINDGISRFHGERRAYDLLNQAAIPAPHVLLLDDTKMLVPNDFMVMTKVEGQPLIDSWPRLTPQQRQQAAAQAGEILARLHAITLDQFGRLYGTQGVFSTWFAYLIDKLTNYGQQAVTGHFITPAVYDRMQAVFHAHRPLLDTVTTPHLIHWDYHFGNLLQQDGVITGLLDFEWALGGDPIHDFNRRTQWDEDCPGSRQWVYAGYTRHTPLQPDHDLRVALYELIWFLDCVVDAQDEQDQQFQRGKLHALLSTFA